MKFLIPLFSLMLFTQMSFAQSICMILVNDDATTVACDGVDISAKYTAATGVNDLAGISKILQSFATQGYKISTESAGDRYDQFTLSK